MLASRQATIYLRGLVDRATLEDPGVSVAAAVEANDSAGSARRGWRFHDSDSRGDASWAYLRPFPAPPSRRR